jgi:hypothetical protein
MQASKLHAATVRLDAPTWKQVEKLAKADRRPPSQWLRLVIVDVVEQRSQTAGDRVAA